MQGSVLESFVKEMIGGVSDILLNNPVIGWGGSFMNIILGICALVAITDIVLSFGQTGWAEKGIRFIFFFTLLLMNFGVINPRSVFDFQLGEHDYVNKPAVDNKSAHLMDVKITKPKATLDRDIYNALVRLFDDLANELSGNLKNKKMVGGKEEEGEDIQSQAIQNTLYFLWQVRIGKMACYNNGNTTAYITCLKNYVPYEAELGKDPKCAIGADCGVQGGKQIEGGSSTGASDPASAGVVDVITNKVSGGGIGHLVSLFVSSFGMLFYVITDFAFVIALPIILWLLEIVRNIITLYFVIRYGFQASLTLMFAKIMSPMILIPSKWPDVKKAYMIVFSTALFGFMSKLFVLAATILSLGLHAATYRVIAPRIYDAGSGVMESVKLTAEINGLVYLVYFGIFVVLLLQIMSMMKINEACEAFMSFSVTQFVGMGQAVMGSAINGALALGAIVATAPLAAGAMAGGAVLKGGAMAVAKGASGAASKIAGSGVGKMVGASKYGMKAKGWAGKGMGMASNASSSLARKGMNSIGNLAEYGFGEEVGAKTKQMFGSGGGVKKTPVSISASPDSKAGGEGYDEVKNKKDNSSKDNSNESGASTSSDREDNESRPGFGAQRKKQSKKQNKKNKKNNSNESGASTRSETASEDRADPFNAFAAAEEKAASKKKANPFKNSPKGPKFLQNPVVKAALAAGNLANAWSGMASGSDPLSGAMSGFRGGMGNKIQKGFEGISTSVSKKLDEAYLDEGFRNKVSDFNRKIDNVDSDVKMETSLALQSSVGAMTSRGELNGKSESPEVMADFEKFNSYQSAVRDNRSLSEDDMKDLSRIKNSYDLNRNQQKTVGTLMSESKEFNGVIAEQKKNQEQLLNQYTKKPTAQNAQYLTEAINRGEISKDALTRPQITQAISNQSAQYNKEFNSKLSAIDEKRLNDSAYVNKPEVRTTLAQADRFAENNSNLAGLVGNQGLAQNLSRLGKLESGYADSLSNMKDSQDIARTLDGFSQTVSKFTTPVAIGNNKFIRFSPDGNMMYFNGDAHDNKVTSISVNDIKDEGLVAELRKQKQAYVYSSNNPEIAVKHRKDFDKMASIFNFIKI